MKNFILTAYFLIFSVIFSGCSGGDGVSVSDLQRNGIGNVNATEYLTNALSLYNNSNFLESKTMYEKAVSLATTSSEQSIGYAGLGFTQAKLGNFEDAITNFKRSTIKDARFGEALSLFRRNQVGDLSNAIISLEKNGLNADDLEFLFDNNWGFYNHDANALYALLLFLRNNSNDLSTSSRHINYANIKNQIQYSQFVDDVSKTLQNLQQ